MASFNDVTLPNAGGGADQATDTSGAQNPAATGVNVTGSPDPTVSGGPPNSPSQASTGSGVDWNAILKQAPGIANLINGAQAPGQLQNQAASYTNQANQYGAILNPYGAYRQAGATALANLQADPSSVANTPGYKFSLQQELGAVANRDNRSFGVGAGSTNPDLMNFAQGLASKTYNDTVKQYSDQAGVGIGPQAAASIYQTGMLGNIAANQAANAAKGANTTNAITTGAGLLTAVGGVAGLAKIFQNSGMSPTQAAQMAHQVMGLPSSTTTPAVTPDPTTPDPNQGPNWDGSANPDPTAIDTSGYIDPSIYDVNYG